MRSSTTSLKQVQIYLWAQQGESGEVEVLGDRLIGHWNTEQQNLRVLTIK